jgi:predicted RNA methylase
MNDDSNEVWAKKPNQYIMDNYYIRQYNEEYESVKFIKKYIINLKFNTLIDCGCGSGSLIYFLKKLKQAEYFGVDICEETLKIAKEKNPDCIFFKKNINNINNKYDVTISNQTILCISPNNQLEFINKQFELSNKYVVFFSLFTDSELTIDIKINDPYNNEIVYYNILPISKLESIAYKFNFEIEVNEDFNIKKKINKPLQKGRGTYTIETKDNKLLQFSDVVHMPWKIIIFKKIM